MSITLNGKPISSSEFVPVSAIWRPGGTGYIELAGIDPTFASQVMRGLLYGDRWFSLRPVCVSGRYGFDGLNQIPWQPGGTLYVQLSNNQVAMWHTPENDAALNHDRVLDYAGAMVYDGPIPAIMPDWSRVPWMLTGRELLGYGQTNWQWISNKMTFIRQMRECIGDVPGRKIVFYADLFGSTSIPAGNDPGYWMRHPEGVIEPLRRLINACRENDILCYLAIWSGNYKGILTGSICDPYFSPALYRTIITTIRDTFGPAGILICPAGEPWHPDAVACQDVMREIHAITYQEWPGWRIANWNEPTVGFLHELHLAMNQFGPVNTIDLGDNPDKIQQMTLGNPANGLNPTMVAQVVRDNTAHGNATIAYDMDLRAWDKDQSSVWQAIGQGARGT